jgi:predicted metal-dependent phosphoesterase TrpH
VPGYEPFLLCDFHVHTRWSDGRLSLREVVDLYGKTRRFDVIAITDHILMERDMFARAGRMMSLGRREFSVTAERFDAYLTDIEAEARRARRLYDLLVIPGAEITPQTLSLRGEQRLPQAQTPLFVEDAAAVREELGRDRPNAARQRRCRADALSQWFLGSVNYHSTFTPNCTCR